MSVSKKLRSPMNLTRSFQGRFLIVAALLGVVLLVLVVYTKQSVYDDSRESASLISRYKSAEKSLKDINDLYLGLKSSLYQYTLLLTPELKDNTLEIMVSLRKRCDLFKQSDIVHQFPEIKNYFTELEIVIRLLTREVNQLLEMQESAQARYPAVKILLDELQPYSRAFQAQLSMARDEATEFRSRNGQKIQSKLNEIRFYWARRISEVRLFVANRSGTFGDPEKVLPENIATEAIFAERVSDLLDTVRDLSHDIKRSHILREALDEMSVFSRRYTAAFKQTSELFMEPDWRADVFYLESRIEPLIKRNQDLLKRIEHTFSAQMGQLATDSIETSGIVTSYIGWFVTAVYFLLMLAYFAFEKSIRQPLYEVSRALEAQGRNEPYTIVSKGYHVSESEVLINAFEDMKEQVDSRQLRLQTILQNVGEGIVITDRWGVIETFNPAAEKLFGQKKESVVGQSSTVLLDRDSGIGNQEWLDLMTGKSQLQSDIGEIKIVRPDRKTIFIAMSTSSMLHMGETYYISVVVDVTERKALMDSLQNLADMDSLTGLHNRRYYTEELDRLVDRSLRRQTYSCAVLFIDLDNFKYINDSYGHHAGDRVLIEVSTLLQEKVRKSDLLARLGGDEFAVILYDVNVQSAREIANKYQKQITGFTFYEKGKVLDVGCTIGVAMMEQDVKGRDDFLMRADYACQMAKQLGRNRVYVYSQEDGKSKEQMLGHIGVSQKIKDAIREDGFRLDLQPICSTSNKHIYCYEVLLRMIAEDGKDIMPFGFLPSAERFDLMLDIDRWVVRNAIKMLSELQHESPDIRISINLSAQSIGDFDFINIIEDAMSRYKIAAGCLIFEITESVAISHMETASRFLQHLRDMGCKTALDDFGAGYSSYAYLKDLPADFVKIDGSFVKNMDENELSYAMVKSMHDIAHVMGKKTIAEFVENEAVLSLLQEIGVDFAQGFYLGKPAKKPLTDQQANVIPIR